MNLNKPVLNSSSLHQLVQDLQRQLNNITDQLNGISKNQIAYVTNAYTAPPTGGTWAQGDFIANSAPIEYGAAGAKFIIIGWTCIAGGTPGTWVQTRCPTGD